MNKIDKFIRYNKLFIRIHFGLLTFGILLLAVTYLAVGSIESIARTFLGLVYSLFYVVIILFIINLVRLLKYMFGFRKDENKPSVRNIIIIILTSPISFGVYFILMLAMSLSLASCS